MCRKTPAFAYYNHKIKTTRKSILIKEWQDAPITNLDLEFLQGILNGLSYQELSEHFNKSESRIGQWKRSLFEKLHRFDMQKLR